MMGLAVNKGKMKYILSTSRDMRRIRSQTTTDNYTFDVKLKNLYILAPLRYGRLSTLFVLAGSDGS